MWREHTDITGSLAVVLDEKRFCLRPLEIVYASSERPPCFLSILLALQVQFKATHVDLWKPLPYLWRTHHYHYFVFLLSDLPGLFKFQCFLCRENCREDLCCSEWLEHQVSTYEHYDAHVKHQQCSWSFVWIGVSETHSLLRYLKKHQCDWPMKNM